MHPLWLDPGHFLSYQNDQGPDIELTSLINHSVNALSKDAQPQVLKMLPVLGLGAVVRGQGGLQPSVSLQQSCA